jgi:UDP-2,3-diacylglucosamine pyrophosphatase LpxH
MPTTVYVVSDLHLGGGSGFRMCSDQGVARLAALFEHIAAQVKADQRSELVIAGDIVDFLAVEDAAGGTWSAFTKDEDEALGKLDEILETTKPVWDALARLVRSGCFVTLMLGNHDIELSFPKLRRRLLQRLGGGPVEFLYDNQAYANGKLLIEHGNRYDNWNVVDHDALRRVRSLTSRGQKPGTFAPQPGSELVVKVMNKIKRDFSWIDLMKPETSAVVPLLAVLATGLWRNAGPAIVNAAKATWRERAFRSDRMPDADNGFVGAAQPGAPIEPPPFPDDDILQWVEAHVPQDDDGNVAAFAALQEDLLFEAMRKWAEKDGHTFAIEQEHERYLEAAATLARSGFEVVIFGHTHHAKRIKLADPAWATYLNTGTWADLIRVPEATLTGDETNARAEFGLFVDDLAHNRVERLRKLIATFACVELDDKGEIANEGIYFFDEDKQISRVTTAGVLERLQVAS